MNNTFVAKVIDVNDPEKAGRLKIRIFGEHDDKTNIPDDLLPWARCMFPVTAAVSGGISGPTTGAIIGSSIMGMYVDSHRQIPLVIGTLGAVTEKTSDFSKAASGEDFNTVLKNNVFDIGSENVKYAIDKTIGSITNRGESIVDSLKSIGQGTGVLSGLKSIKDTLTSVKNLKNAILTAPDQFNSIISGYISSATSSVGLDELKDILHDLNSAKSELSTIGGIVTNGNIEDVLNLDTEFSSVNHLVGSISTRLSTADLSPENILNRLGGAKFSMGSTMAQIEGGFASIKGIAAQYQEGASQLRGIISETKSITNSVNSVLN